MATTSQPRSLLSIARLNMARSRMRPSIWSLVRIDQTCFGRSGGFAPVGLPLFHGTRLWDSGAHSTDPAWSYSSVTGEESMCHWLGIVDPTNLLPLRKSCILSEPRKSLIKPSFEGFVDRGP